MYTGKVEKPCCLCDDPSVEHRLDLPPRAIRRLQYGEAIAWQDIVGHVSIHFCDSCWETARELVLDTGMSPLPRCNVARASFDLREDFEAFTNRTREEPDQRPTEERFWRESRRTLAGDVEYPPSDRDLVQARVVRWALEELDAPVAGSRSNVVGRES
jgi:hypothetical protein